jgi:RNA polymerase sigma-70 factor, ECF subfamily
MSAADLTLLTRWIDGRDADAFRELAVRHGGTVFGAARRILRNASDAEEVAQECFETLAKAEQTPKEHVGAWLHRVATNRALNRLRGDQRRNQREQRFAEAHPKTEQIKWDDLYSFVDEAIAALPDELRTPLVAQYLQGDTQASIAQDLKVSRQTVSYRVNKGIDIVRDTLRKRGIVVPAVALCAMFEAHLAEAAPATLLSAIGKLAIAGATANTTAAIATPVVAGLMGAKALGVAIAIVLGVVLIGVVLQTRKAASDAPIETAPMAVSQEAQDSSSTIQTKDEKQDSSTQDNAAREAKDAPWKQGMISGVVLNPDGQPASNDAVLLRYIKLSGDDEARWAPSSEKGRFSFDNIEENTQCVLLARCDSDNHVSQAVNFTLASGGFHGAELRLGPGASIEGHVLGMHGNPITQARPKLEIAPFSNLWGDTETNNTLGHFGFSLLSAGTYTLRSQHQGSVASAEVTLNTGESRKNIELRFEYPVYSIKGQVLDRTGKKMDACHINHRPVMGDGHEQLAWADESGAFHLTVKTLGRHELRITHEGYMESRVDAEAGDENVQIILEKGIAVAGTVVERHSGIPITDFTVGFRVGQETPNGSSNQEYNFAGKKREPGHFEVSANREGDGRLIVSAPGFASKEIDLGVLRARQSISGLAVKLDPQEPARGFVIDEHGAAVTGAWVFPVKPGWSRSYDGWQKFYEQKALGKTASDGAFILETFTKRTRPWVFHPAYLPAEFEISRSSNSMPPTIVLTKAGTLEGRATINGEAWAECTVNLHQDNGEEYPYNDAKVDEDGYFKLTGIFPGEVQLNFGGSGRHTYRQITIASGRVTRLDVALGGGDATLRGQILLGNKPVQNVSLHLNHADANYSTLSDAHGMYSFDDVPKGIFRLSATLPEIHASQSTQINLSKGTQTQDFHFVPADAVIEGTISTQAFDIDTLDIVLLVETPLGAQKMRLDRYRTGEGRYRVENAPVGEVTMIMNGKNDTFYEIQQQSYFLETHAGTTTTQDIVFGAGAIEGRIASEYPTDDLILLVIGEGGVLGDIKDLPCAKISRLIRNTPFFHYGEFDHNTSLFTVLGLNPGKYTVCVYAWNKAQHTHKTPLGELPSATAMVEVDESGPVQVDMVIE